MIISLFVSVLLGAQSFCTSSAYEFTKALSDMRNSADSQFVRTAFPYADFIFDDDAEMFEELAIRDSSYSLSGVTYMWDTSDSSVLVLRIYPSKQEGSVCMKGYRAHVIRRYPGLLRLPDVVPYGRP